MDMVASFRDASIKRKLRLVGLFVPASALLLFSLIQATLDFAGWRGRIVSDLTTYARMIGANAAPAILFDDQDAATETLSAFAANPDIIDAVIYDKRGMVFARYISPQHLTSAPMPRLEPRSHLFSFDQLVVSEPIRLKGEVLGSIYLESDLRGFYADILLNTVLTFIAALAVFLAYLAVFSRLQQALVSPILELANTMRKVSTEQSYAVRVAVHGNDEVGVLASTFNDMLAQIQSRDAELGQHRKHLEGEVATRTARLTEAQRIAHLGNWEWDIANNKLDWSYEIYRIFGLAQQQFGITYETFLQAVHPEDRQFVDTRMHEALEQNRPYSIDHRILLPDGTVRHVHEQAEVSRGEDGRPVRMRGTVQDITEYTLAEERIRESEARYRSIFEYADDIIYLLNPDGTFRSLSPSFERITGWTDEEWIGKPFAPIVHPDDLPNANIIFQKTLSGESTPSFRLRIARKSGEYFDADLSITPIGHDAVMGIARDVTENQRAELEIRKQQELTTQIIETIPMRVFWKDRELRYLGSNTLFAKDAGLNRPGELIGKTDFEMVWQDQAELYRADDRLVMDSNTPKLSYDEPQTTPEGRHTWLRTSKVPLHNAVDETIGVLGVYEDITGYKQMELRLLESEERFRKAFQNSAVGMALVGLDGRWLKVNDSLCQIVGYPEQELLAKTFQDITHPDDLQTDLDFVRQLLAGKIDHYQMEKRYIHKDGHIVWIRLSVSLIRDVQNMPINFVSQIDDISENKLAEERIRQMNEELETKVQERTRQLLEAQEELVRKEKLAVLGQVAGSVGHELRNPLGVMNNAVYFLQTVLTDADETTKEYLNIIKDEIAGSERIVSDLLDAVRTKPPHPEIAGVAELIGQTLRKCNVPSSITVKLDIPATLPPLRVDAQQIHQVFRNLISNGIEAMTEGGVLEIRAVENKPDGTVTVSVRDSGSGIAPEVLPKLFQPLFTTKARGIGLGLVVVRNLTQANGGTVKVESEAGKGTVFSITLLSGSVSGDEGGKT